MQEDVYIYIDDDSLKIKDKSFFYLPNFKD